MNWLSTHCYTVLAAPKWQVTTNTNNFITICTFVGEHDDSEWSTLMMQKHLPRKNPGVWEPDVMVVDMPTPSSNGSPKKTRDLPFQPPNHQHTLLSDILSDSLKTYTKIMQEIFQRKSLNPQTFPCCFFFFGHQGATNISTSCQLRYQTPSLETDGFLKVGP